MVVVVGLLLEEMVGLLLEEQEDGFQAQFAQDPELGPFVFPWRHEDVPGHQPQEGKIEHTMQPLIEEQPANK